MKLNSNIDTLSSSDYKLKSKEGMIFRNSLSKKVSVKDVLKDIQENHNQSWYDELYERNKDYLDDIALIYRGNNITYREMFDNIEKYAKSLKKLGLGKNSEIPVCLSNTPEIVYIIGAASKIGASVNIFGSKFSKDYITEILKGTNSNILFIEDNEYIKIEESILNSNIDSIVMISLRDSLKNNYNPYEELDSNSNLFINRVDELKNSNNKIISQSEFLDFGKDYIGSTSENVDLDDDFIITYTSGSTNSSRPKGIVHSNRSYITVARYHNIDLNGGFSLKPYTFLALIPTYSNSNFMSIISDSLMQGSKLAFEPNYNPDSFLDSLIIHNPHYVAATKSFWIKCAKKLLSEYKKRPILLKNLFLAFSCGEQFEINEEKLINKAIKKAKAGVNVTHTPFSIVKMSEAGGDCEHGSIFYTLFRSYSNLKPSNRNKKVACGMGTFDFVEFAVLDEEGNRLGNNRYGRLVANSPCTMKEYKNNPQATNKFYITDSEGKRWADMNVYGYVDNDNKVHLKGRIPNGKETLPPFYLSQEILKDTKNILSCEVVEDKDNAGLFVAHIELQPNCKKALEFIVNSANERCKRLLEATSSKLYFRVRSNEESFPLTGSGKRDVNALKNEKISEKCVIPIINDGKVVLKKYSEEKGFTKKKV